MKSLLAFLVGLLIAFTASTAFALPTASYQQNIFPFVTDRYDLGSSTPALEWNGLYVKTICLSGDCKSAWPSGSGGSGSGTVSTSSVPIKGQLAYWTTTTATPALLSTVATTSLAFSGPFSGASSLGALVGGSNSTVTWTGLATTSQPASSNVLVSNGAAGVYGVATTSETCSAPLLCGAHAVLGGGGAITWTGLATTTQPASSNLLVSNGAAGVYGVSTSTLSASSPLTGSFTQIDSGGSLGCQSASGSQAGCLSAADWSAFNMKVATSAAETVGQLAVWGTTNGSPAKLYSLATTAVACSGNISCTGFNAFGAASTISFTGTLGTSNGGTGTSTWLTNSIPYFNGTRFSEANSALSFNGSLLTLTNASTTNVTVGTFLTIPNSSSQAPTLAGQLALDTTNDQLVIGDGSATSVFDKRRFLTLAYSTTTAWTGSTTLPAMPVPAGMTFNSIQCKVNAGTLNVQVQYGSAGSATVFPAMLNASTTMGTFTWSSNNTPPSGATTTVTFGTPASSPVNIGCTINGIITGT